MPPKAKTKSKIKIVKLPMLEENFDEWDLALKHCCYAAGWIRMYEASAAADGEDADAEDEDRQAAWGTITQSLPMDRLKRIDTVPLGQVEALIRSVRHQFYRETAGTKNNLKTKMLNAQLENYDCFETYAASLMLIFVRLLKLGYTVDDEDRAYHLLRGLPSDYDAVKSNLELPRDTPLSWNQHMHTLREFVSNHPGIVGSLSKHKDEGAFNTEEQKTPPSQQQVCRDFAKGQCNRGNNCRYKHVKPPLKCSFCGKPNHHEKDCWGKQRSQAEETKVTTEQATEHDFTCAIVEEIVEATVEDVTLAIGAQFKQGYILVDGASTCHIAQDAVNCFDVVPCNIKVRVGGNRLIQCNLTGKRRIHPVTKHGPFVAQDVRIIPDFGCDILAEPKLLAAGCDITKNKSTMNVKKGPHEIFTIEREPTQQLFYLKVRPAANTNTSMDDDRTTRRRI